MKARADRGLRAPDQGRAQTPASVPAAIMTMALAIVIFINGRGVEADFITDPLGPAGFLYFVAGGVVFGTALMLVVDIRQRGSPAMPAGRPADAIEPRWWRVLACVTALISFVTLLSLIGFLAASALCSAAISAIYGERSVRAILLTGLLTPLLFWLVFHVLLQVELPGTRI